MRNLHAGSRADFGGPAADLSHSGYDHDDRIIAENPPQRPKSRHEPGTCRGHPTTRPCLASQGPWLADDPPSDRGTTSLQKRSARSRRSASMRSGSCLRRSRLPPRPRAAAALAPASAFQLRVLVRLTYSTYEPRAPDRRTMDAEAPQIPDFGHCRGVLRSPSAPAVPRSHAMMAPRSSPSGPAPPPTPPTQSPGRWRRPQSARRADAAAGVLDVP